MDPVEQRFPVAEQERQERRFPAAERERRFPIADLPLNSNPPIS